MGESPVGAVRKQGLSERAATGGGRRAVRERWGYPRQDRETKKNKARKRGATCKRTGHGRFQKNIPGQARSKPFIAFRDEG